MSQGSFVRGAQPGSTGREKHRAQWLTATALCGLTSFAAAQAYAGEPVVVISDIGPITITGSVDATNTAGPGVLARITNAGATGGITLDLDGAITGSSEGILAENFGTGDVDIHIGAGANGTTVTGGKTGIQATTASGNGTINIDDRVTVKGETAIGVKSQSGGTFTVNNSGTIDGAIRSEGGATNLTLTNSGTWIYTNSVVSELQGNDQVFNNGTMIVAGTARFNGLEKFTNNGTIDLRNGNTGDRLEMTGDATLNGRVRLDVDLRSGKGLADLIQVDGVTDGNVTLDLGLGNGAVPLGGLFADRILLVDSGSGTLTFTNDPNELGTSGFINYIIRAENGDIFIVSELDETGAGGVVTSIASTLNAVATIFHKPSSAFTTGCNDPNPDQVGFGTWARSNGGSIDTQLTGTSSIGNTALSTRNRTDFYGVQAGLDTAFCNIRGKDLTIHTGLTGGYVEGTSDQLNGGLSTKFDSYFVGLYGALSKGAFSTEAELRYDDHSLKLSNDNIAIITPGTDTDGETYSGMLTGTYEVSLSETTKLYPSAGITISNTSIDPFSASGGTVRFDDLFSVMGFAGVTATTTIPVKDNLFLLPFASATVYNEFAGKSDSSFTLDATSNIETERIGTFGQVGLGVNAALIGNTAMNEPNVYGSLRVDAQVGDRIQGWGVTGAVRVQF